MINENDIALIDAFIAGDLIGNDKTDFEYRVKRDLEFAKAVRQQIHAVEHLEIFGAVSMGASFRSDMKKWKSDGGYKPYKSTMAAKGMLIKVIAAAVVLAAIAGALWYFLLKEAPTPIPKTVPEAEIPEPVQEPTPSNDDAILDSLSLTELKTSEEQIADMQLNVQDPTTFSIVELKEENGIYTYQISYDDVVNEIRSKDADLDEILTRMAEESIAENEKVTQNQTRTYQPKQQKVTSQVQEEPVVEETKPEPKPKPRPVRKKSNEKVVDDFPY